jgi:vitamin K epoxide reductase
MFNKVQNWLFHEDLKRRHMSALALLVGSGLGLLASLALSIESLVLAKNSEAVLSCDLNSALSCSAVANHWSAAILGFPNSFIGLATLPVMITIAVALLAGTKFPKWFMQCAQVGVIAGLLFAFWMFGMSYLVIGALCPWCLTLDLGMISIFFGMTRYNVLVKNISGKTLGKFVDSGYDMLFAAVLVVLAIMAIIAKFGDQLF